MAKSQEELAILYKAALRIVYILEFAKEMDWTLFQALAVTKIEGSSPEWAKLRPALEEYFAKALSISGLEPSPSSSMETMAALYGLLAALVACDIAKQRLEETIKIQEAEKKAAPAPSGLN